MEGFDIVRYADVATIYTIEKNKESVIAASETSSTILFKWFNNNFMTANNDKSHLLMSCKEPYSAIMKALALNQAKNNFS